MNKLQERVTNVVGTAQGRVVPNDNSSSENPPPVDMTKINAQALKPMSEDDVFVFQFELSNSNVDAYFTRMTQETLQNYADRITTNGVPLQPNHDSYVFPIGRIYDAEVTRTDDGVYRLICTAYIVRGDENESGVTGDAIIRKVETGVQKDVSIGFIPGGYTCSVCGNDMVPGFFGRVMSDECDHIPGAMYDGKVCYAWVEDGTILEGSLVYTGATPQAIIQKAVNAVKLGKLDSKMVRSVNRALNIQLSNEEPSMKAKELLTRVAAAPGISAAMKVRLETRAAEAADTDDEEKGVEAIAEEVAKTEDEKVAAEKKAAENEEVAADGRAYRETVVNSAIEEGVRAMGDKFDKATMETHFRSATISHVLAMKNQYSALVEQLKGKVNNSNDSEIDLPDAKVTDKKDRAITVDSFK